MTKLLAYKPFLITFKRERMFELVKISGDMYEDMQVSGEQYQAHRLQIANELIRVLAYHDATFCWEPLKKVTTECVMGHSVPDAKCTCGIYSTYSYAKALEFAESIPETIDEDAVAYPVLGVIQVLGHTEVDEKEKTLRSWGGFLWGLVKPNWMNEREFYIYEQVSMHRLSYNFFGYPNVYSAYEYHVNPYLELYNLKGE